MQGRLDVDAIINQLINSGGRHVKIKEKDISHLCKIAREIFMEQPVFLELEAPIKICGKYICSADSKDNLAVEKDDQIGR